MDRAVPVSWNRVSVSSYNYPPVVNYDRCLASPCVSFFFFFYRPYGEAPRATSRLIVSVFSLFIPPFRFERTELCRISRARILLAEVLSFFYSLISFSKEKRIELRREETRVKKRAKWSLSSWILN